MTEQKVFSICGMCTVRCPIMAEVENGEIAFLQGNPHAPGIMGSLCARGAVRLPVANHKVAVAAEFLEVR